MRSHIITTIEHHDLRFPLPEGAGSDAVHTDPEYSLAVTALRTDRGLRGTGFVLTLGAGNRLVTEAIGILGNALAGREVEELMADFGEFSRRLADHPQLRWVGPHKGVVHLALASITNACFDLWAKARGVPLWSLLLELTPDQVVSLLDLSYVEDVLTREKAVALLAGQIASRPEREPVTARGYPGYDTSVGWFRYEDERVREAARAALERGFLAFKLKVGSQEAGRDVRRARLLRECVGEDALVMLDANQRWTPRQAIEMCRTLADIGPYWIEEPTHPDDVRAHRSIARAIAPMRVAAGEHIPNRVSFKNFIEAGALHFVQADCTRLAGVSEFLTVSLLARACGLPVAPHVGDMGQIHQHLVLFNHVALGHELVFLEHIPHLRSHFVHPAVVEEGRYRTPQEPGCSTDLLSLEQTR